MDTPEMARVDASLDVFEGVAAEPLREAEPEAETAGREPDAALEAPADADAEADEAPVGEGKAA